MNRVELLVRSVYRVNLPMLVEKRIKRLLRAVAKDTRDLMDLKGEYDAMASSGEEVAADSKNELKWAMEDFEKKYGFKPKL